MIRWVFCLFFNSQQNKKRAKFQNKQNEVLVDNNVNNDFPENWIDAEIIQFHDCDNLRVQLSYNGGIAENIDGKLLTFDNIEILRVPQLEIGVPQLNSGYGTVSHFFI